MRGLNCRRGVYLPVASLVVALCFVVLASFCATNEMAGGVPDEQQALSNNASTSANSSDDGNATAAAVPGEQALSVETLYQPSSCTHVVEQGELVTENQWVDCSFGVQSLNLTYDGEDTLFIVMDPDGAFSLCTRQPFGTVFDDDAVQMWIYTPTESMKDDLQLEITYSQRADTFAYSTGLLEDYDESFSSYSVEELRSLDTYSYDKVSSLQTSLREGNWSSINKDLNSAQEEEDQSAGGHNHFPIYNRITLRNTNKKDTAALIIDSLVLVNNYTSQKLYVTSVRENSCELPYSRLPSPPEVEETFRSMLDVAEVEKQKSAIPLFAGIATALFLVAVGVAVLTIVIHTKKLRHLYIPFDDLEFDTPPEIIGRGKFGYVLRGSYNSFPVATKLVLPSNTAKGTMFESSFSSIGSESKGTVTYLEGNNEKSQAGSVEYMYTYGKETNAITMSSRDRNSFDFYSTASTEGTDMSISSNDSSNSTSTKALLSKKKWRQRRDFENEIRLLMKLRHPNIVTIMGVSKDTSTSDYVLVMERMSRGSLIDCLTNPTTHMDNELILGIMKDIAAGMAYLHNLKPAVVHNDLRAANILIDDNFTAKISDFGLSGRQRFISSSSRWPWTAPEIFGGNLHSRKTDVYSFGVLLIEIFTRCKLTVSDMRLVVPKEAPSFAVLLIRQCLHANPNKRPTFAEIQEHILAEQNSLKKSASMIPARNIMFSHLPAKIAEDIKMGRTPSSTSYKCLTLLMSDIVGYTELTEKLGPEPVTRLLNQFYHKLDDLVTKYHLYKIETIGDAYFAVGGMLEGEDVDTNHCARVMAFSEEAMQAAKEICIPSAEENSSANIRIRIGIHSGPCVGAVVGSLNPKFSLYGDTVNVVSRVESTGKPDNIHVSSDAAELLRKQNIQMSSNLMYRGSTKLKGKGYMQTYWYKRDSGRSSMDTLPSESPSDCPSSPREYSLEVLN
jgi:class 3 adenylate cyclase